MQIEGLIETIGYPAVFFVVMGECMGIPMPGETALLIAAAAAGTGSMFNIWGVIASAAGGAIVGDTIGYWIGWRGGRALVLRLMKRFSINQQHLEKAELFFARHGGMAVFFGRSVSYLRVLTALLAGVSRMRYPRFLIFNALGGISWAVVFGVAGYYFGKNLGFLQERLHIFAWVLLILATLFICIYFLKKKKFFF